MATYVPWGVCTQLIDYEIDDEEKVRNVAFTGGCNGNLAAIAKLVEGKDVQEVIDILKGNICGRKRTSCADQLACALEEGLNSK